MKWTKLKKTETKSAILNVRITPTHDNRLLKLLNYINKSNDSAITKSDLIQNFIDVAFEEMQKARKK